MLGSEGGLSAALRTAVAARVAAGGAHEVEPAQRRVLHSQHGRLRAHDLRAACRPRALRDGREGRREVAHVAVLQPEHRAQGELERAARADGVELAAIAVDAQRVTHVQRQRRARAQADGPARRRLRPACSGVRRAGITRAAASRAQRLRNGGRRIAGVRKVR